MHDESSVTAAADEGEITEGSYGDDRPVYGNDGIQRLKTVHENFQAAFDCAK